MLYAEQTRSKIDKVPRSSESAEAQRRSPYSLQEADGDRRYRSRRNDSARLSRIDSNPRVYAVTFSAVPFVELALEDAEAEVELDELDPPPEKFARSCWS